MLCHHFEDGRADALGIDGFDDAMKELGDLMNDAATCKRRMTAAKTLIDGLRGGKIRWTEQC